MTSRGTSRSSSPRFKKPGNATFEDWRVGCFIGIRFAGLLAVSDSVKNTDVLYVFPAFHDDNYILRLGRRIRKLKTSSIKPVDYFAWYRVKHEVTNSPAEYAAFFLLTRTQQSTIAQLHGTTERCEVLLGGLPGASQEATQELPTCSCSWLAAPSAYSKSSLSSSCQSC